MEERECDKDKVVGVETGHCPVPTEEWVKLNFVRFPFFG